MLLNAHDVREEVGFDFTPIIDIVFNLLIFFLVATSFQQVERESQIALPETVAAGPISASLREIVINVDRAGQMIVNGQPISAEALSASLRDAIAANPGQKVNVRADRATAYENVARALDLCKVAGITEPYLESVPLR
jgi:biopolymer transport protein ExbD